MCASLDSPSEVPLGYHFAWYSEYTLSPTVVASVWQMAPMSITGVGAGVGSGGGGGVTSTRTICGVGCTGTGCAGASVGVGVSDAIWVTARVAVSDLVGV